MPEHATTVTHIAALGRNRVIGDGTSMPWHLPEDLRWFRRQTTGHPIVMGRRTFATTGALPGRTSVVLSRDPAFAVPTVTTTKGSDRGTTPGRVLTASSLEEAMALAAAAEGGEEVFVVGGGEVYRATLALADRLLLTEVDRSPAGSVTYPELDERAWTVTWREAHDGFTFTERRRHP